MLFVEGINVLHQPNRRYQLLSINRRTFEASGPFTTMVPITPSIGMSLDF